MSVTAACPPWRRPGRGLLAGLGVAVAWLLGLGLVRVDFDADVLNLLPAELPAVRGLKLYQEHFAAGDELLVTVRAADPVAVEDAARALAELLRARSNLVAAVVWQAPAFAAAEEAGELLAYLWLNQPPATWAALRARLEPGPAATALRQARDELATSFSPEVLGRLGYDPLGFAAVPGRTAGAAWTQGEAWFASPAGDFRALHLTPATPLRHYRATARWVEEVRAAIAAWQAGQGGGPVQIAYTGGPAFVAEVATGMERDLRAAMVGTLLAIAGLFGWAHRRWQPLVWLVVFLVGIVAGTLALGGLVLGRLHVVSLGFAGILLGLSVDYALVLYQEARAEPALSIPAIRRRVAPGIFWSAGTTAAAFLMLHLAGLPGLSQLGLLVGLGVILGATAIVGGFLAVARGGPALPCPGGSGAAARNPGSGPTVTAGGGAGSKRSARAGLGLSLTLGLGVALTLACGLPAVDHGTRALQPLDSPADRALAEMKAALGQADEPLLLLIPGRSVEDVGERLTRARPLFEDARAQRLIRDFTLPVQLWPHPHWQRENLAQLPPVLDRRDALREAVRAAGFTDEAWGLSDAVFRAWERALGSPLPLWPAGESSRWLLGKLAAQTEEGWLSVALAQPGPGAAGVAPELAAVATAVGGVWTSWPLLGEALLGRVEARLPLLLGAVGLALVTCLWCAFRRRTEVGLSLAALGFSLGLLLAWMRLSGTTWNLINLTALPLLLGAGVDYTIHVQLALRRYGGDPRAMRRVTGRALWLCAATTIAGFGSLRWSGNAGLASLGSVCAVGVAGAFVTALYLLPAWWTCWGMHSDAAPPHPGQVPAPPPGRPASPSMLYRSGLWRMGRWIVRVAPAWCVTWLCRAGGWAYRCVQPRRRAVVVQNLLPVCGGDRAAADVLARRMFAAFALKLADLWRFEAGVDLTPSFAEFHGWETFAAAQARGRGVLLVTPHLGNWELGGPLLARRGVKLVVITQAEPGNGFTELRQASRARWGIDTVVIGRDAFAFVEVIRRLQEGATIAILIDRPPAPSAVAVELFGRPFHASIAAAELARASGCAVLGVHLPRTPQGYGAFVLPEFTYDRQALGTRAGRREFTQEILRAFEPIIRQHAEQWYHFVPLWPEVAQA